MREQNNRCKFDKEVNRTHHLPLGSSTPEWGSTRALHDYAKFRLEKKNTHQPTLALEAQFSVNGFLRERARRAGPRAVRIMSMKARSAAGTCRCPG